MIYYQRYWGNYYYSNSLTRTFTMIEQENNTATEELELTQPETIESTESIEPEEIVL